MQSKGKVETITLGGGCFWCLEPVFEDLKGVNCVTVGYAGGKTLRPTYEEVCSGSTGHAEVTQLEFDPAVISLSAILDVFFTIHDPTTLNRQGADVGTQYRSIILYETDEQKKQAEKIILDLNAKHVYPNPIVTKVEKLEEFFPAEEYHQQYFRKNPWAGYCQVVIRPKVEKFEKKYGELRKEGQ